MSDAEDGSRGNRRAFTRAEIKGQNTQFLIYLAATGCPQRASEMLGITYQTMASRKSRGKNGFAQHWEEAMAIHHQEKVNTFWTMAETMEPPLALAIAGLTEWWYRCQVKDDPTFQEKVRLRRALAQANLAKKLYEADDLPTMRWLYDRLGRGITHGSSG